VVLPSAPTDDLAAGGITVAEPPVEVVLPSAPTGDLAAGGITVSEPPVEVVLPSAPTGDLAAGGITVSEPPVDVVLPSTPTGDLAAGGITVAEPLVLVDWEPDPGIKPGGNVGGALPSSDQDVRLLALRLEGTATIAASAVERHVMTSPWVVIEWAGPAGARFAVESSADLTEWRPEVVEDIRAESDRWTGRCRAADEGARFYRLRLLP
jgi:hypothetical protein